MALLWNCLVWEEGALINTYFGISILMERIMQVKVCKFNIVFNFPGKIDKLFL